MTAKAVESRAKASNRTILRGWQAGRPGVSRWRNGLQVSGIFISLKAGGNKLWICFSFSIQILKEVSLKILCCHDTWFHLKLTILKPWVNQYIFLMEMFVLSYVNVLRIYPRLCLQVSSAKWLRTYLTNQYVVLRYCSPNLCKWNYFYGNLHFYKIQVNRFMAWDESSGTKIIPKCNLSMRGLVPFWVLRHSFLFINRLLVTMWHPAED